MPPPAAKPPTPPQPQPASTPPPLSYEAWERQQAEAAQRRLTADLIAKMPKDVPAEVLERDKAPTRDRLAELQAKYESQGWLSDQELSDWAWLKGLQPEQCWSCGGQHPVPNGPECPSPSFDCGPGELGRTQAVQCSGCGSVHPPRKRPNGCYSMCHSRSDTFFAQGG